ncbi:hypothetical protein ZMO3_ZMOp32x027 (plasmid) [Zymomonas mobilis subsp. mobilis]|nr:hypothetical protein ZMO2_ZMOp32x027 [Zymomonas mobilis subsp. mobilis]AVZ28703.1 hypothetical protein ZMO3_ZMOp32x027 [Zymomonas mobilis subsp. mobilis]
MSDDCSGDVFWFSQRFFSFYLGITQPTDVEIIVALGDGCTVELAPTAVLPAISPLGSAIGVRPICLLKFRKVGNGQRAGLAKSGHVRPHVIDPNGLGVTLVALATLEEQYIGLNPLRIENAGRQAQDGVKIAQIHQPSAQASIILKQHVVGNDYSSTPARGQCTHNMLDEGELLVRRIRCDRKVGTGWTSPALLRAEWWIGQDQIGLGKRFAIR